MAMDDLNSLAELWAQRLAQSGDKYRKGVMAVKESPNQKAARMETKYLNNVQAAVSSGRYRRGNQAVQLGDWQQACSETGAQRLATGANKGKSKWLSHMQDAKPVYDALQAKLATMPNNTLEDAIARSAATIMAMAAMKSRS